MAAAKFPTGRLVTTHGALDVAEEKEINLLTLLVRHARGDWGNLGPEDKAENERSITSGDRIMSAYVIDGTKFYVITEWDRSLTTVLLASEY